MNKNIRQMIDSQLKARGIKDTGVLGAMEKIPRIMFVPQQLQHYAYEDSPLPIGEGQTISQPYMVAIMTELLNLSGTEKVLEIGTGSGYQTAILAELCSEVYTIEIVASLSEKAKEVLNKLGYTNVFFKTADGTEGWPDAAPFDRIIVAAATDRIPAPLFEQLKEGGKMAIPLGDRYTQVLTLVEKLNEKQITKNYDLCTFVPLLVGKYGAEFE